MTNRNGSDTMTSIGNEELETMEKNKSIPYRLDEINHKTLKLFCVEKGFSMQELMDKAVQAYLKKWEA